MTAQDQRVNCCHFGHVFDVLPTLAGLGARCCVTSPPYWGLRDYGADGQLGLERTPEEYVANMVRVFRLVWDVLADDGTLWLNLGDCYSRAGGSGCAGNSAVVHQTRLGVQGRCCTPPDGMKPKDLVGIPWMVAFALRADGWYLRSDIIWHKPNPMPESVTDRPTKAHEYLFLLSKRERYYYDAEAIAEPSKYPGDARHERGDSRKTLQPMCVDGGSRHRTGNPTPDAINRRDVWTVASQPYSRAHFATYPPALIKPCILAGSAPGDIVIDPFLGSGTTAQVAQSLGRRWVGCELNQAYKALQDDRASQLGMAI